LLTVRSCSSACRIGAMWSSKSAFGAAISRRRTGESVSIRYLIIIIAWPRSSTAWA
jgi:hypothetical protein